ncbi:MAG: hypothetical protein Q8K57_11505 [Thiobacillus sp.]|nr:hypothetical protein [Thiobacillus sp.]MDP3125543.1 hypothetical protein [Thiobacillus sp.]
MIVVKTLGVDVIWQPAKNYDIPAVITTLVLTFPLSAPPKIEPVGWISGKGV